MEKDTKNPSGSSCSSRSVWYDWSKNGPPESSVTHPVNTHVDWVPENPVTEYAGLGHGLVESVPVWDLGSDPQYKEKSNLLGSLFIC